MKLIQLPTGDYIDADDFSAATIDSRDPMLKRTQIVLKNGSSVFVDCSRDEVVAALEKEGR